MDANSWIADGTKEAEPVTSETPANTEGLPGGTEAVADEGVAGASISEGAQPRDEHGRFAPKAGDSDVAAETPTPAEQAAIEAFLEGKLGDQPFVIPKGLQLPFKNGKEVNYLPVEEVHANGLRLNDYSRKMNELAESRRAFEAERAQQIREARRVQERERLLAEREEQIRGALTDPKSAAAYEQHLHMLATNPMYKRAFDREQQAIEQGVDLQILQEERDQQLVQEASQKALGWVESIAAEFPGVDPGRVASIYGQRLSAGQASLSEAEVRQIYRSEADYVANATKPLQDQLAELVAKIDSLSETKAAEKHNAQTQHAVQRAKTVPVATGVGAPTKVAVPPTKFSPNELAERNAQWARGG